MGAIVGVAHVRWELPFALRLEPGLHLVWEESMGVCAIDLVPSVGSVTWARTCSFLSTERIYPNLGPPQDPRMLPNEAYLVAAVDNFGAELPLGRLIPGTTGGFEEATPYTVANTFLCLTRMDEGDEALLDRATKALNNLVRAYKALTLDPWVRELDPSRDAYMTVVSLGKLPNARVAKDVKEVLDQVGAIAFPIALGAGRTNRLRMPSSRVAEVAQWMHEPALDQVYELSIAELPLDLLHLLVLSAIDHLSHGRHHLAVTDAQTAFEVAVEQVLRQAWKLCGKTEPEIDDLFSGDEVNSLERRLQRLDRAARELSEAEATTASFLGSQTELNWREYLYRLRKRVVHAGLRDLGFDEARAAVRSGLMAMDSVFGLHSSFQPKVWWEASVLELAHVRAAQTPLLRMMI